MGCPWRTRCRSIRINGFTSRSTAAACSIPTWMSPGKHLNTPGDYAKQLSNDPIEGFAFFEESIELSRRCRALKLWLSLRYHGLEAFRAAIARDLAHARRLAKAVSRHPELELLSAPELSAVCFRHLAKKACGGRGAQLGSTRHC